MYQSELFFFISDKYINYCKASFNPAKELFFEIFCPKIIFIKMGHLKRSWKYLAKKR